MNQNPYTSSIFPALFFFAGEWSSMTSSGLCVVNRLMRLQKTQDTTHCILSEISLRPDMKGNGANTVPQKYIPCFLQNS